MAGEKPYVVVEGLDQVVRAFRRVQPKIARGIQSELRIVAGEVAERARRIAESKGLAAPGRSGRGTGELVADIRPSVRLGSAWIIETVKRKSAKYPQGYNYAKVYEFGGRMGLRYGPRAFMYPAAEQAAPALLEGMDALLNRVFSEEGFEGIAGDALAAI